MTLDAEDWAVFKRGSTHALARSCAGCVVHVVARGPRETVHVVIHDPTGEPIIAADISTSELEGAPMPRFALTTGEVSREVATPRPVEARRRRR